eukprot:XP_011415243.1 PREDICTED: putative proline-rich receptor-like protein kinase PERK6 [Crassostrea gigas]
METAFIIAVIFYSLSLTEANYCYYSYYYSNYYCSNGSNEALDSRSIAGIVVGCVIAMAAIVIMVIFCKKKEKGTRVVEIRSNGNTQVHTITSMHPAPGPPGGFPGMARPPGYATTNPAYPPVGPSMFPPPPRYPAHQYGGPPGIISGPHPATFPPPVSS